jgi:hypothetical protein
MSLKFKRCSIVGGFTVNKMISYDFYTSPTYPGKVTLNSRIVPSVDVPGLLNFIHFNIF